MRNSAFRIPRLNMKSNYLALNEDIQNKILSDRENHAVNPYRCGEGQVVRRNSERDTENLWRPAFVRDVEKILHLPTYNRYSDKTQVFSFRLNDDLSRRGLHVQLVSRIARNISNVLGLNSDLTEAIALGHDLGHTPFGHTGEKLLSSILHENTGRYFNHNVHSVRVLDGIFNRNVSLQTLDGILCHNGEIEQPEYRPGKLTDFAGFDNKYEACYTDKNAVSRLTPSTLEGCVVRICDMISYLGKDRQDAVKAGLIKDDREFDCGYLGSINAEIINNLTVDIIENSYGKDYIKLSEKAYAELKKLKKENYEKIYLHDEVSKDCAILEPMFKKMYERLLNDIINDNINSTVYKSHINYINENRKHYGDEDYSTAEPNQIVTDYIAGMTDDYFIALFDLLFPDSEHKAVYKSYFEESGNLR